MNKREAKRIGLATGENIGRSNLNEFAPNEFERYISDCQDTESEHYRQFSPFEFTANEFNDSRDPDAAWDAYENGVYRGLVLAWRKAGRIAS